jgi:hypothetical protein
MRKRECNTNLSRGEERRRWWREKAPTENEIRREKARTGLGFFSLRVGVEKNEKTFFLLVFKDWI